jgi:16S rRNA C967 or C1407 C5-methylase (RsmB/RsmF family)/NOL1/NOP2/fmu family ribosome biogenesis protein
MFPEEFITRIKSQKLIDPEALLKSLSEPEPVSIRINPAKWFDKPSEAKKVPWCETGWYLNSRPSYTLDPLFHSGCYYPQEASSMFIEKAFNLVACQQTGLKVLDLCGAPGGKSTHISSLLGDSGLLVANDVIRQRATVLAETLTKWGNGNSFVTQNDPEVLGRLNGFFDIILVDAPCSGEGMFRDAVARNEWSPENGAHCSERQKRILMDIWPALKENGILIYSTCTFNPDENEKNIRWLTDQHKAESILLDISEFQEITEIEYNGIRGYGFYPDKIRGNGFFISVLRKLEKADCDNIRNYRNSENIVTKNDIKIATEWIALSPDEIFRSGDDLFGVRTAISDFFYLKNNTRLIKAGTHICSIKKNDYLPSHELALSVHLKNGSFPHCEIDYQKAVSMLRRDNISFQGLSKGWYIAKYSGVNLGFIKNIGSRVNNYFPVEWRIRMNPVRPGEENLINWDSSV